MALTANFKKFVGIVLIVGVSGALLFAGNKNNFWGLLDKKPTPEVATVEDVAPPPPAQISVRKAQEELQTREIERQRQPDPAQVQDDPAPAPSTNSSISKLKGMSKL